MTIHQLTGGLVLVTGADMKLLNIVEKPDGSAITQWDMSQEEVAMLLEYAVVNLLKEAIEGGRLKRAEGDEDVAQQEFGWAK